MSYTNLSELTLKNFSALQNKFDNAGIDNPNEYLNYLKSIQPDTKESTFLKYASNLNSMVKHEIIKVSPEQKREILDFFVKTKLNFEKNKTPKKRSDYQESQEQESITAPEELNNIVSTINDIPNPQDRLLVALYTLIPPLRSDYCDVIVVDTESGITDPNQNYLILDDFTLVLNNYKRMNFKDDSPQETKIFNLKKVKKYIIQSLQDEPRDYLFETPKHKPYSSSYFAKVVSAVFKKYYDIPYTINSLRHLYATAHKDLPVDKVKEIADGMNHSYTTHIKLYEDNE